MIEVIVRNRPVGKGSVFYYEPETVRYVGELLDNPKHVADDCLVLSGDGFISYRVIPLRDLISVNGDPIHVEPVKKSETWMVKGSKNQEYVVTRDQNRWSCTCVGFQFHKDCKHIREKKSEG